MSNNYTERSLTGHIIAKGEAGKTAYEYALAGGFTGTEEEFAILLANQGGVKSVNGAKPDENGNIEIDIPEGFSGSWNDLEDKPFGEAIVGAVDFEWDGNLSGFEVYDVSLPNDDEEPFIKISDIVPINVDLQTISGIKCDADGLLEFSRPLSDFDIRDGYISYHDSFATSGPRFGDAYIYIVMTEEGAVTSGFPSTGIYVAFDGEYEGVARYYFKEIHLSDFEDTIKIPEKYIPDHPHSWNDLEDKPFGTETETTDIVLEESVIESVTSPDVIGIDAEVYYVEAPYNVVKEFKAGEEYAVIFDGTEYRCLINEIVAPEGRFIQLGNFSVGEPILNAMGGVLPMDEINDDWTNNDCPFYMHCVQLYSETVFPLNVVTNFDSTGSTFSIYHVAKEVKTLDPKFLPEHLQFGEVETTEVVLEETVINGLQDASEHVGSPLWMGTPTIDTHCTMNPNDTYLVTIGDKAYICNTSSSVTDGTYDYVCIGNHDVSFGLIGLEEDLSFSNPEAPFYIVYTSESEKVPMFANFDINGSTLSIHHMTKEIKKIDAKYLPLDEILGVIENGTY